MKRAKHYLLWVLAVLVLSLGVPALIAQETTSEDDPNALRVAEVFPANASIVPLDAEIIVVFNRPVVGLVTSLQSDQLPNPLRIVPEVAGRGEWLNTSIYTFKPDALAGGTTYTVTIPQGLVAADGTPLAEEARFRFTTEAPRIADLVPTPNAKNVDIKRGVQVRFTQAMNQASVEAAFLLQERATAESVAGTFEWAEDGKGFRFMPNEPLKLETEYNATLRDGAIGVGGGAALTGTRSWQFTTVPLPSILRVYPLDGATEVSIYESISITFASPMDFESVKERVSISPALVYEPEAYYSDYSNRFTLYAGFYPSTTYTVTLEAGAKDIYGNVLNEGRTFSFKTSDFDADVSLRSTYDFGFYNAYRDPAGLYLTHVNVERVDLRLFRVPNDAFLDALRKEPYALSWYLSRGNNRPLEFLAEWSIRSVAPRNATRFEFLRLGDAVANSVGFSCGGLPAIAKVGDVVRVLADPPLRARSEPVIGDIVKLFYANQRVTITDGPRCGFDIVWWEVFLGDGRKGWIAEGADGEYFIEVDSPSQVTQVQLPEGTASLLSPGVYFLRASADEVLARGYSDQRHVLIVGTANLHMKMTVNETLVWVTDLQTGAPLPDRLITLYTAEDDEGSELGTAVTDADGIARIAHRRHADTRRIAILNDGEHYGVTHGYWSDGISSYDFGISSKYVPRKYRSYVYTDRPIYRPDQPVYFKGNVRARNDVSYTPHAVGGTILVEIRDYNGNVVYSKDLPVNKYGTFSDTFTIAPDAPLGYYYLEAIIERDRYGYLMEGGGVSFMVAEYRLPEFLVNISTPTPNVAQNDTITLTVDSRYFFGGSVSNANVSYNIIRQRYNFRYKGAGFYDFADINYDGGPDEFASSTNEVASGTGVTDDEGKFTLEVPADLLDSTQSQTFTMEATVTDETDQAVSGRASVIVHKGLLYVGVRPRSYVGVEGEEEAFELIAVDWDSAPIANQELSVRVVERKWFSVREKAPDGRTNWTWEVEETPIAEGNATTDSDGKASFSFTPPNGGVFKAYVSTRDANGNEVISSTMMWVAGKRYISWRQQNSNRIDIIKDKPDYALGDVAEILITSPFQGTTEALITVERAGVMAMERVKMESNTYIYRLPITEEHVPNVFVGVVLVKGVDDTNPVTAFRMGYTNLSVATESKVVTLDVSANVDQAQPQSVVTYTIQASDHEGKPVQAEVGVGVTDLAALSLLPPNSSPLLSVFYGQQMLGILNASALTRNADQVTQEILDTIKGGGGGFLLDGLVEIRGEFIDTPYWNATLETDANGTLTFDVRLPDNLTTWRLDARAMTEARDGNLRVGETTFDLISTKPLIIRPVTPRFFVRGDNAILAAVVNNNTKTEQNVVVTLNATGVTYNSPPSQTVTIPAGGRGRVTWDVTIEDVDAVVATFRAEGNGFSDGSISPVSRDQVGTLPVYRYDVPETVGTAGVLLTSDSLNETVLIPQGQDIGKATLNVTLEHSLASSALATVNRLDLDEFDYLEWSVSVMRLSVVAQKVLTASGQTNPELSAKADAFINATLQRLYARQRNDGGWGWSGVQRSDPNMTAYALLAMAEAREAGYVVSEAAIQGAARFLRTSFVEPNLRTSVWQLNRQAFMLYALALAGAPDVGRTNALFESYPRLSLYGLAFLANAIHRINPNDARLDTLASVFLRDAVTSATGINWQENDRDYYNWNTDTRTSSLVLGAMLKIRPQSPLLPNAVRYLVVQRQADRWATMQETVWTLHAFADWMQVTGELQPDYRYTVALDGTTLSEQTAVTTANASDAQTFALDVRQALLDTASATLNITREGSDAGALYYTARLTIDLPVKDIQPLGKGVFIERRYTRGDDNTPISEGQVGEVIDVLVTVIAPNNMHYVVIQDPLPAGAEGINPRLSTSQQLGTRPSFTSTRQARRYGWGWWWFSNVEFRDQKVVISAPYLPAGTYEFRYKMRLGVSGVYNVIPAQVMEVYFPERQARTGGMQFTIGE
jgi:uncharacterized protein YfaS (alpha-2-macroglobulin family)